LDKRQTVESYWLPGINRLGKYGRWAFLELQDPFTMRQDFAHYIKEVVEKGQRGYSKVDE
jgi:type III restriction enzyme